MASIYNDPSKQAQAYPQMPLLLRRPPGCEMFATTYVARVRFGIRVRVRDSEIFEKGGCGCGGTQQLKNY